MKSDGRTRDAEVEQHPRPGTGRAGEAVRQGEMAPTAREPAARRSTTRPPSRSRGATDERPCWNRQKRAAPPAPSDDGEGWLVDAGQSPASLLARAPGCSGTPTRRARPGVHRARGEAAVGGGGGGWGYEPLWRVPSTGGVPSGLCVEPGAPVGFWEKAGGIAELIAASAYEEWSADALVDGALLHIEVLGPAVQHQLRVRDVRKWLEASAKTPAEKLVKERLRGAFR